VVDLVLVFALQLEAAYIPVVAVSLIHMGYLILIYLKGRVK
jgi:hypothetical protein